MNCVAAHMWGRSLARALSAAPPAAPQGVFEFFAAKGTPQSPVGLQIMVHGIVPQGAQRHSPVSTLNTQKASFLCRCDSPYALPSAPVPSAQPFLSFSGQTTVERHLISPSHMPLPATSSPRPPRRCRCVQLRRHCLLLSSGACCCVRRPRHQSGAPACPDPVCTLRSRPFLCRPPLQGPACPARRPACAWPRSQCAARWPGREC